MEKSLFFDAVVNNGQPDRVYSAADIAMLRRAYWDDGVLSADALKVSAGIGMIVQVAPGAAVVYGYNYILDTYKSLTLDSASSLPRIDLVVLRLDLAARTITPTVIKGTPAIAPATPSHLTSGMKRDLPLAKIEIAALASSSSVCVLTDLRRFASEKVMEAPFRDIVSEELAERPMLSAAELASVKTLLSLVSTGGTGGRVLCDDGQYRTAPLLERVELVRYTEPGEYEFTVAQYPSANGLYDVEVIGGGGAGGSVLRKNARGGGGGAGSAVTVSGMRLPCESVGVWVGVGGKGVSGSKGGDGGQSYFGPVVADGGFGGQGGNGMGGGSGGQSTPFYGEDGKSGSFSVGSGLYITECGAGASGFFGKGAKGSDNAEVSVGSHASGIGAGGSGAGGEESMSAVLAGGKGSDGAVIVYGYRAKTDEGSV